jgi:phosphoesterase RecJ-like protein
VPVAKAARDIVAFVRKHKTFLCSGHIRSDGDALGSQLALAGLLKKMGKKAHCVCDHGTMPELAWLPGADKVGADPSALWPRYDAVLTCDSGSWRRLERISAAIQRDDVTVINIDHHASNERFGDINWIDPSYSSTGEMIWDLAKAAKVKPDRAMATCVYTAIVTDTGSFRFSNTTPATHRNALECLALGVLPADITKMVYRQKPVGHWKLASVLVRDMKMSDDGRVAWMSITPAHVREAGFEPAETQDFMDIMKSIKGVLVAILFRPQDGKVKVSWRTDRGIDGIALASKWGGGGHPRASGASVPGTLAEVESMIVAETLALVAAPRTKEPATEGAM